MRKYCKAYHLRDLRQFHAWEEILGEGEDALTDDAIVYLQDDLTVVKSPVLPDTGVIWSSVTAEWQEFCQKTLHFKIPADLCSGSKQGETEHNSTAETTTEQSQVSL